MDGFLYRVGSPTSSIGRPPRLFHASELASAGCAFASVYAVREEDARAIEAAGTAAGFRGIVWSRRLWIDFDDKDAADRAETYLNGEGYDYVSYDTGGGRGRHLGVLRDAQPSHLLPLQDKEWVREHCPGADLGLYWHLHLIRLPGAVHEKTGERKRVIAEHPGRAIVHKPYVPTSGATETSSEAMVRGAGEGPGRTSIFRCWGVTENLVGGAVGGRQKQLVNLAVSLRRDAKVTPDEALWVVTEVNRGFDVPKEHGEVERIVRWAYGCD